jgi:hypothetical protein
MPRSLPFQADTDSDVGAMAFRPPGMDRLAMDGLVSSLNLLTQSIQQLGLAVIPVAFLPECCRVYREHLQARQGLAGRQGRLCDSCRGQTRQPCRLINS